MCTRCLVATKTCKQNHGMDYGNQETCFKNEQFSNDKGPIHIWKRPNHMDKYIKLDENPLTLKK